MGIPRQTKRGARWVVIALELPIEKEDGTTEILPIVDTAVDLDASDIDGYRMSGFDEGTRDKYIKLLPGATADEWLIRPMTPKQKETSVGYDKNWRSKSVYELRCGLRGVRGEFMVVNSDGEEEPPTFNPKGTEGLLPEADVLRLNLPSRYLIALSGMVVAIGEPPVPFSKS